MQISYECENCNLVTTFEASDGKAAGNASWDDCFCPKCNAVLGNLRCDWGMVKVVSS